MFQTIIGLLVLFAGLYQIGLAVALTTQNAKSAVVFRMIPTILGLLCILGSLVILGVIK